MCAPHSHFLCILQLWKCIYTVTPAYLNKSNCDFCELLLVMICFLCLGSFKIVLFVTEILQPFTRQAWLEIIPKLLIRINIVLTEGPTLPWGPASPGRPVRPYEKQILELISIIQEVGQTQCTNETNQIKPSILNIHLVWDYEGYTVWLFLGWKLAKMQDSLWLRGGQTLLCVQGLQ